jgi:hypothetical protein
VQNNTTRFRVRRKAHRHDENPTVHIMPSKEALRDFMQEMRGDFEVWEIPGNFSDSWQPDTNPKRISFPRKLTESLVPPPIPLYRVWVLCKDPAHVHYQGPNYDPLLEFLTTVPGYPRILTPAKIPAIVRDDDPHRFIWWGQAQFTPWNKEYRHYCPAMGGGWYPMQKNPTLNVSDLGDNHTVLYRDPQETYDVDGQIEAVWDWRGHQILWREWSGEAEESEKLPNLDKLRAKIRELRQQHNLPEPL